MLALEQHLGLRRLWHKLASSWDQAEAEVVPPGFRNSLHWNLAHVLVTQQLLTYGLSGLDLNLPEAMVAGCRKGTSCADWPEPPPLADTIALLVPTAERFAADYAAGAFSGFKTYQTSAGIELDSLDAAITFNNAHEGIHIGYCLALRRCLPAD